MGRLVDSGSREAQEVQILMVSNKMDAASAVSVMAAHFTLVVTKSASLKFHRDVTPADCATHSELLCLSDGLCVSAWNIGPISIGGQLAQLPGGPLPAHNFVKFS